MEEGSASLESIRVPSTPRGRMKQDSTSSTSRTIDSRDDDDTDGDDDDDDDESAPDGDIASS